MSDPDAVTHVDATPWTGATGGPPQKLAEWCVSQVGAPVLMGSKGNWWEKPDGTRVTWPDGLLVFDCSGLITYGLLQCGGPDLRDTHNAQRLYDEAPPVELAQPEVGSLGFYGADPTHINHVVLGLAGGHLVSADGATHRITSLVDARDAGAQVRVHDSFNYRRDEPFWGWRPSTNLFPSKGA